MGEVGDRLKMLKANYLFLSAFVASVVNAQEVTVDKNNTITSTDKEVTIGLTTGNGNVVNVNGSPTVNPANNLQEILIQAGEDTNNTLNIKGDMSVAGNGKPRDIYAAKSKDNKVSNNTLNIEEGAAAKANNLYAGHSENGEVTNNTVNIKGNVVSADYIHPAYSKNGNVTNNVVNIISGVVNSVYITGGKSENANSTNNTIKVTGGTVNSAKWISGGYSNQGSTNNNIVDISGGTINTSVRGGTAIHKDAIDNTINISGGNFSNTDETKVKEIIGGYSDAGKASNNVINITGGTFANEKATEIYAGKTENLANTEVTNNVINLNADNLVLPKLYGVGSKKGDFMANNDHTSGNTLNVNGKNITAFSAQNFNNINFNIGSDFDIDNDTMLKLNTTDAKDLDYSKTTIGLTIAGGIKVKKDDEIKLINAQNGTVNEPANNGNKVAGALVGTEFYDFIVEKKTDNKTIVARVDKHSNDSPSNNIPETSIAEMGALNNAGDLVLNTVAKDKIWGALKGSEIRYKSGSHVDLDGVAAALGASKAINNHYLGVFMEFGGGRFHSFNRINVPNVLNLKSVSGKGNLRYYGLGLKGDMNFTNDFYIKAILRAGLIKTGYTNSLGWSYDSTREYFGGALELGKKFKFTDASSVNLYTKGFYTELNKTHINVIGDSIKLGTMKSLRARFGATYNYKPEDKVDLYIGAAYEREFEGKAKAYNNTHEVDILSPNIKGNTGIINLGIKADVTEKLNIDLSIEGNVGKREGVAGGIVATYKL